MSQSSQLLLLLVREMVEFYWNIGAYAYPEHSVCLIFLRTSWRPEEGVRGGGGGEGSSGIFNFFTSLGKIEMQSVCCLYTIIGFSFGKARKIRAFGAWWMWYVRESLRAGGQAGSTP